MFGQIKAFKAIVVSVKYVKSQNNLKNEILFPPKTLLVKQIQHISIISRGQVCFNTLKWH